MPTAIRIINDTILPGPKDPYETGLTPREAQTRLAFFILAFATPLIGAVFALFTTKRWWTHKNLWSFPRLCALWFISVAAVAAIVFFQPGRVTRSSFVIAIIHGMVEIAFTACKFRSNAYSCYDFWTGGFCVSVADIGYVFVVAAIVGGVNDFLLPLILLYGRQPLLAIGAFGHTIAAVSVFTSFVHDFGIIPFSIVSFFALWIWIGFTIAGLRKSSSSNDETPNDGSPNDMHPESPVKVTVPHTVLAVLVLVSLVASTITTILLAYVAPKVGGTR